VCVSEGVRDQVVVCVCESGSERSGRGVTRGGNGLVSQWVSEYESEQKSEQNFRAQVYVLSYV